MPSLRSGAVPRWQQISTFVLFCQGICGQLLVRPLPVGATLAVARDERRHRRAGASPAPTGTPLANPTRISHPERSPSPVLPPGRGTCVPHIARRVRFGSGAKASRAVDATAGAIMDATACCGRTAQASLRVQDPVVGRSLLRFARYDMNRPARPPLGRAGAAHFGERSGVRCTSSVSVPGHHEGSSDLSRLTAPRRPPSFPCIRTDLVL